MGKVTTKQLIPPGHRASMKDKLNFAAKRTEKIECYCGIGSCTYCFLSDGDGLRSCYNAASKLLLDNVVDNILLENE